MNKNSGIMIISFIALTTASSFILMLMHVLIVVYAKEPSPTYLTGMSIIEKEKGFIDLSGKIDHMINSGTNKRICIKKSEEVVCVNINCALKPNLCKNKFLFGEEYKFTNLLFDQNSQEEPIYSATERTKCNLLRIHQK